MEIKKLEQIHLKDATDLILNVFMEFQAPEYSIHGIQEFKKFIAYDNVIEKFINNQMSFWGCFMDDNLVGVISTRNINHICLLFVKKEFHRQGIAKNLFNVVLNECSIHNHNEITVNSSSYATDIYHHLEFTDTDKEQVIDGIFFTPMKYIISEEKKMFKEMRRKDKQLSMEESIEVLKKSEIGVLSTICENGYPYGVPVNFVYFNNSVFFHCAKDGQKLDNIKYCDKVSFCATCDIELLPDKFDTNYKSVILFGKASETDESEKKEVLLELIKKYSNNYMESGKDYIVKHNNSTKTYKIIIEHITGKAQQ